MKRSRWMVLAVLAGVGWTGAAFAQAPGAAAPGGAAGAAAAGAGAAGAAKPGFFEKVCTKLDKCRRKLCSMPAGQMISTIMRPASQMSGGIIPPFCPAMPTKEEQQDPGSKGAAAQGAADAADAKKRVVAVQYLGTLDCHWFPEAEAGLVKALRLDRNECVRLAAAVALNRGCCCTRAILDALIDCVDGTEKMGPYENSPRVQSVALLALEKCLSCYHEPTVVEGTTGGSHLEDKSRKEDKPMGPVGPSGPADAKPMNPPPTIPPPPAGETTLRYSGKPTPEQIEQGRMTVARARSRSTVETAEQAMFANGQRDLYHLYRYVLDGGKTTPTSISTPAPMVAQTGPVMVAIPPTQAPAATISAAPAAKLSAAAAPAPKVSVAPAPKLLASDFRPTEPPAARLATPRTIDPKVMRCMETLHDSADPEVRHTAVKMLATVNWQENPEALMALVHAARTDKHPGMRVACVRSLAAMKACTPEVMTGLKPMTHDSDEWIRTETVQALTYLQSFMTVHADAPRK